MLKISSAIATVLAVSACTRGAAPIDFSDPLTGPVSPAFTIPFDKYALTPAGLERTASASGTENGIDRPIIKTVSGDYLLRDFVFEVDVRIPADHGDIAWVGFGQGINSRFLDNEPTNAFVFRIHNLPDMPLYGVDVAVAVPGGGTEFGGAFRSLERFGTYTPGLPLRVRIEHRGGVVTMSIPGQAVSRAFAFAEHADLFDSSNAYLFFSNSSEGTTFENAVLRAP